MAMADTETKSSRNGGGGGKDPSKASPKKKKKSQKRKQQPQPGDPGYMTPTQLRNARKRRKKKQDKAAAATATGTKQAGGNGALGNSSTNPNPNNNDPSLKYLSNPKAAPTVRNAIKFFREKTNAEAGTNHDAYFPVVLGPKLGWRTVARLAVRVRNDKETSKKKLNIGLFVPGSHDLLPVPDCPVHHRKINGLVKVLEDECNSLDVPALDDDAEAGDGGSNDNFGLRYVAVAVERTTQKQQLVLVWKEPPLEQKKDGKAKNILDDLIQKLVRLSRDKTEKEVRLHSVWIHYNNTWKHSNSIFDREGSWETKFVDGEKSAALLQSGDNPLFGAIRETMLPLTTKAARKKNDDKTSGKTPPPTSSNGNEVRVPLYFPPQVFRQANLDGFAKIILRIREWLREQQSKEQASSSFFDNKKVLADEALPPKRKRRRGKRDTSNDNHNNNKQQQQPNDGASRSLGHCLELYGGVGTIGLNLVDLFDSLDSSDENPFNKACFHAAADETKILRDGDDQHALLDPSKRSRITYTSKSASEIVTEQFESIKKARVVVVDPPRKGLDPPVIEALCSDYDGQPNQQQALVYVSCGFDAFRRDYRALVEGSGKWKLDCAEGHILFPGSDAIETLAFFTRAK